MRTKRHFERFLTLSLLAIMSLVSSSVKAVDEIEEGVDYYILNVETDLFLGGQNSWGTKGCISEDAGIFQFVKSSTGRGYNIKNTLVTVNDKYLGTNLFVDTDGKMSVKDDEDAGTTKSIDGIWEIQQVEGGIFAFYCPSAWSWGDRDWVEEKHGYLTRSEETGEKKGFNVEFSEDLTDASLFYVMTRNEALSYLSSKAKSGSVSFNFLLKNPDFCRNQSTAGWNVSSDCTSKNLAGGANDNMCAESWRSTFTISQIVKDLPAGRYQLSAQGFYQRYEGTDEAPYLFAGNAKVTLPEKTGSENSMTDASNSFSEGNYQTDPVRFEWDGSAEGIEIGFRCDSKSFWAIFDNIQLTSYSEDDVPAYAQEILAGIKYPIEGLGSARALAAYEAAYNSFKNWVEGLQQGDATFDEVDQRYADFVLVEDAWKASIADWSNYVTASDKARKLYTQIVSQEGKYNPSTALNAINSYINGAAAAFGPGSTASGYTFVNGCYNYIMQNRSMDDAAIANEVAFLDALMNDVKRSVVKPGMDVTFLLQNPDFSDPSGAGWNGVSGITSISGGLSGWPCAEAFDKRKFDIYQIVENAPAGLYSISVNAFYRPAYNGQWTGEENVPVEIYMGSVSSPIQHIAKDPVENDLVWDEESRKWIGVAAKNGTNCYYWDYNSGMTDAEKESIWKDNENEDPEIRERIAGSTSWTTAGRYNPDYIWDDGSSTSKLVPNGMDGASVAFSAGRYPMTVYGEVPDEGDGTGTLRIGIRSNSAMHWALWSNFRLELLGEDAPAMRQQLIGKLNELMENPLINEGSGLQEVFLNDTVLVKISEYDELVNGQLQDYQVYKDAYDVVVYLIDKLGVYQTAINKFRTAQAELAELIANFSGDENIKKYARNVYDVYDGMSALETGAMISLTNEDQENLLVYDEEVYGGVPDIISREMLMEDTFDPSAAGDGAYTSTYDFYYGLLEELRVQMGSIYIQVRGTGTAEVPENVTDQLRNPSFDTDEQWWGDNWGSISYDATEQYKKAFDTYQSLWLPAGYYTFVSKSMDRRSNWNTVINGAEDEDIAYATYMYVKTQDGETIAEPTANARYVAQKEDITEGAGEIADYIVEGWYTPNSMAQFNAWMEASREKNLNIGNKYIQFEVPEGGAYTSIGFFRNKIGNDSWFIADGIELYYAADTYPEIDGGEEPEPAEIGDYTIDCSKTFYGGVVTADKTKANAGDEVVFTAVPKRNYYLDGMTLELTVEAEDAQARPVTQSRVAVLTTIELPMTYDAENGIYTGVYTMINSNVTLVEANFVPKKSQDIVAEDINVYENVVDVYVVAENKTEGGGALSYAVASGSDVVEVNAETGAVTILKSGQATIVVTAAGTEKCIESEVTVNVTVKAIVKKTVALVRGMATFYDPINAYIIPERAKAWTGMVDESADAVVMSEITGTIPAGTPVLLTADSSAVVLTPNLDSTDEPIVSDLRPTDEYSGMILDGSENIYALHYGAFVHVTSGSLPAGKAYIYFSKANNARLSIIFDEETGISNLKAEDGAEGDSNAPIYDLAGRRLTKKPASGYYIQNGKRYFSK